MSNKLTRREEELYNFTLYKSSHLAVRNCRSLLPFTQDTDLKTDSIAREQQYSFFSNTFKA